MGVVWRINPTISDNANIDLVSASPSIYEGTNTYNSISSAYGITWYGNIDLTITAKNGFKFDSNNPPNLLLRSSIGNAISGVIGIPLTLSNNDTTASISGSVYDLANGYFTQSQFTSSNRILDLYTTTIQTVTPPNVTYTNNVSNCTLNSIVNNDNSVTATLTASNGYYFNTVPTLQYIDTNNQQTTVNFTLSNNDTVATVTFTPISGNSTAIIDGTCIIIPTHNIINNVSNTTLNSVINNNTVELTLTAIDDAYYFTTVPTVTYYENGIEKTDTFSISIVQLLQTATITINADKTDVIINGVCQIAIPITRELSNVTLNGIGDYLIPSNQNVLNLLITANNGYCLDIAPYIEIWGASIAGDKVYFTLDTEEPIKTATLIYNIDNDYNINNIREIVIHCFGVPLVAYNFGAVNVYKVTKQNLNDFSLIRYGVHDTNLNDYVVTIKRLFFNVGDVIADTLKCGNIDTNINCFSLIFDKKIIDCGFVDIPMKNNDNLDYESELTLFIPFFGFYSLNSDFVGKRIYLKYECSTLTGQGYAKLYFNDICFDSVNVDCSDNIFFEKITDNAEINQFRTNYLNGLQPYLIIKYYNNMNNHIYNNDCIRVNINSLNGFNIITEITDFQSNIITQNEYDLLLSELKNGVFIESNEPNNNENS